MYKIRIWMRTCIWAIAEATLCAAALVAMRRWHASVAGSGDPLALVVLILSTVPSWVAGWMIGRGWARRAFAEIEAYEYVSAGVNRALEMMRQRADSKSDLWRVIDDR